MGVRALGDAQGCQERDQHQPGAVGHGHQEGPGAEAGQARGHAEAHPVAVAVDGVPGGPAEQDQAAEAADHRRVEQGAEGHDREDDGEHGQGVAERDRDQGHQDHAPAAAVQAQCGGEQPAHGRVEAVEGAEPGQAQPGPEPGQAPGSASGQG